MVCNTFVLVLIGVLVCWFGLHILVHVCCLGWGLLLRVVCCGVLLGLWLFWVWVCYLLFG